MCLCCKVNCLILWDCLSILERRRSVARVGKKLHHHHHMGTVQSQAARWLFALLVSKVHDQFIVSHCVTDFLQFSIYQPTIQYKPDSHTIMILVTRNSNIIDTEIPNNTLFFSGPISWRLAFIRGYKPNSVVRVNSFCWWSYLFVISFYFTKSKRATANTW